MFDPTRARLANTERRAALTLEGAALNAAQLDAETADIAAERIAHLRRLADGEPDIPPTVFGALATAAASGNEPANTVARLARRALDGAPKVLPEAVDRPPYFYHACIALTMAEHFTEALSRFDEAIADARRFGSLLHVLGLSCYRALLHVRIGNLAEAEADARVALETGSHPSGVNAADQPYRFAEQFQTMIQGGWLLAARGRLRLAELRPAMALTTCSAPATCSLACAA